ncbi:MAG TPA: SIS domain-containing protein [Streptosporangiaceae bacterium]|nr:SIS domain-containing protein [Streptosporangiaceae bacterium]
MTNGLDDWGGAEFVLAADRLDTPDVIEAADPGDMLRQVASSAAQVRAALRSCLEADLSALTPDARPRAIVVAGMGASGLAGEILGAVTGLSSPVQIVTSQAERLPGWVGAADAVVAVSPDGTTGETLALAAEAARRGCRLAAVAAKDSPLQHIAEQARAPFVPVVPAGPPGSVLPRSMLWAQAVPLLVIAERLGVARIAPAAYELAASRLEEVSHQCRPASESFVNPGKSLALDLVGTLPVVWGTSVLSSVAARRFASQLSENAKYPAIVGLLPEAAHDQIAAFDGPFAPAPDAARAGAGDAGMTAEPALDPEAAGDLAGLADLTPWDPDYDDAQPGQVPGFTPLRLVLIADPGEDQRVGAQRAAITELAAQRGIGLSELAMDGEQPLVRLAGVIQLADYASVYLAIASGIDPGQTAAITDLSARIE